jgi:hypothetical protein
MMAFQAQSTTMVSRRHAMKPPPFLYFFQAPAFEGRVQSNRRYAGWPQEQAPSVRKAVEEDPHEV